MDLLLICNQAQESAVIGNVLVAMDAQERGETAAVLFTSEALAALAGQAFDWPPLLKNRQTRNTIAKNAARQSIPMLSQRDARQTDVLALLIAARERGVTLLACPIWSGLLGIESTLPGYLQSTDRSRMLTLLHEARTVIGTL